jgi:hypothetical protein
MGPTSAEVRTPCRHGGAPTDALNDARMPPMVTIHAGCGTGPHSPMHLPGRQSPVRVACGAAGFRAARSLVARPSRSCRGTRPQRPVMPCDRFNRQRAVAPLRQRRLSSTASDRNVITPHRASMDTTAMAGGARCCHKAASPFSVDRKRAHRAVPDGRPLRGCRAPPTACGSRAWACARPVNPCCGTAPQGMRATVWPHIPMRGRVAGGEARGERQASVPEAPRITTLGWAALVLKPGGHAGDGRWLTASGALQRQTPAQKPKRPARGTVPHEPGAWPQTLVRRWIRA